ncbi:MULTISPECIES: PTS sugar transporter subunit IIA [unclassified Lactobacillus]|uniref:PTS sugar transporter subunit IIA n=1 Tax=unclassified Lactobacillus TaxID=2620435 RepID=UPI000EFAA55C|nr:MULTISPECIES: PTS sugar transporter subunit IIA [unclassified Lactobacillus]RMC40662.1 PTS sugar transporter subunit IIA [Lactobacillus sp. ESL0237]RMC44420.1 PTS sugar transporter subunit IIA [Lactobacillus sp. ESL0234]RMC45726.1 PTS sugar transporter subunit IIA [Lactobacillus sp. ESL0236]RMC46043.1 PTS sugar transporter subunit IIA [Lactobacillus sp. ESL0230]
MIGVIVCMHGNSALELVKSAEMICGKQENCYAVNFTMGESLDKLSEQLTNKIELLSQPLICLTDLKGGTPFNTLVNLKKQYSNIEIVAGVNMPMLLELFVSRKQMTMPELLETIIEAGTAGVYQYVSEKIVDEDEEF